MAYRMHVARIFRGWVCPGVDTAFLVRGDDGGAEGPERGTVGVKRRSAEEGGMKSWSI